jgi:GDP-L-fucose synthase
VFPDDIEYPIDENVLHQGPPHKSNQGYAYAKRMLEVQTRLYNDRYIQSESDRRMICVIPTNVYGEYDNFSLEDGHVIPALIHKCFNAINNDKDFIVRGSGKPLRQFVHAQDLGNVILWILLESKKDIGNLIIAPNEEDEVSIGKVAQIIKQSFEKKYDTSITMKFTQPDTQNDESDGQYKKTADNTKLRTYLPDFKFQNFEKGIDNCIDWFIDNYHTLRK